MADDRSERHCDRSAVTCRSVELAITLVEVAGILRIDAGIPADRRAAGAAAPGRKEVAELAFEVFKGCPALARTTVVLAADIAPLAAVTELAALAGLAVAIAVVMVLAAEVPAVRAVATV
jgi:hypothetical protein